MKAKDVICPAIVVVLMVAIIALPVVLIDRYSANKMNAAIVESEEIGNPFLALESITSAASDIYGGNRERCLSSIAMLSFMVNFMECNEIPRNVYGRYSSKRAEYIDAIIKTGNPEGLLYLYHNKKDYAAHASRVVEEIVRLADSSDDAPSEIMMVAGIELSRGKIVQRDTARAIDHLTAAWHSGEGLAAALISEEYRRIGDYENEYLWALRCVNECQAGNNLNAAEQMVPYSKRIAIQKESR